MSPRRWCGGLLLVGLLAACARPVPDHDALTWWIEDAARGVPRSVDELLTATPPDARLLAYLHGDETPRGQRPPLLIARRAARGPELRAAFQAGHVVLIDGEVAPLPRLRGPERRAADAVADAENADRRQLDALVMALGDLTAEDYLPRIRAVRTALDQAQGGQVWTAP
jgi:hypothetical protein